MRRRKLIAATILALGAALGATVATPPPTARADTESGSFYAGNIWEHHNRGGQSKGIFFDNVGYCDSAGYVVNLGGLGGLWDTKISSVAMSGNNGCNAMKVYAKSGLVYTYLLVGVTYNAPAYPGWNDSCSKIRFYHFG
jgi:hypothetical protein